MSLMPPDPDDDDDEAMPDEVRAAADSLFERWQAFETEADRLGLYVEGQPQVGMQPSRGGPKTVLIVQFTIGTTAFTPRVQAPEEDAVQKEFDKMERSMSADLFLDERARIEKGLAEGKTIEEIMEED